MAATDRLGLMGQLTLAAAVVGAAAVQQLHLPVGQEVAVLACLLLAAIHQMLPVTQQVEPQILAVVVVEWAQVVQMAVQAVALES